MIELNPKTQQDFLNREWVQKLLDAGVDMSDAKYYIARRQIPDRVEDIVFYGPPSITTISLYACVIPTYTVSELLYKLHEWIYPTIDGKEFSGGLKMLKDAPFYIFYYDLKTKNYDRALPSDKQPGEWDEKHFFAEFEYPIESLASLLIQCHQKDIGIKDKTDKQISDTGNISDK